MGMLLCCDAFALRELALLLPAYLRGRLLTERWQLRLAEGRRMRVDVHRLAAQDLGRCPAVAESCALGASCCRGAHMIWERAATNRPRAPLEARAGRSLQ